MNYKLASESVCCARTLIAADKFWNQFCLILRNGRGGSKIVLKVIVPNYLSSLLNNFGNVENVMSDGTNGTSEQMASVLVPFTKREKFMSIIRPYFIVLYTAIVNMTVWDDVMRGYRSPLSAPEASLDLKYKVMTHAVMRCM